MHRIALCLLAFVVACDKGAPAPEPMDAPVAEVPRGQDSQVARGEANPDSTENVPKRDAGSENETPPTDAPVQPSQQHQPEPRVAFSPQGLRPSKTWPFHAWDSARAYAYNLKPYGPDDTLRVYEESNGWDDSIAVERELSRAQGEQALRFLDRTQGDMHVSKCPYPRHAVVLFAGNVPVGSINVCFECGDILIWPPYKPHRGWADKKAKLYEKLMPAYDRVFPRWKSFFEDDVGLPIDWKRIESTRR